MGRALDGDTDDAPTTWMPDSSLWRSVLARDPASPPSCPRTTPSSPRAPSVARRPDRWPRRSAGRRRSRRGSSQCPGRRPRRVVEVKHPEWGRVRLEAHPHLDRGAGPTVAVYRDPAGRAEATDDLRRRLVTAHNAVGGATGDLSGALGALRDAGATAPGVLADLPVVPATEQEVVAFNAAKPAVEVAAIYPTEGWVVSEVPVLALQERGSAAASGGRVLRRLRRPGQGAGRAARRLAAARLDSTDTAASGVVATEPR